MKKIVATIVAGALLCFGVFALAGCSSGGNNGQPASDEVAPPDKTLIVGFDAEYPPYGYLADKGEEGYKADDGQTYTGFDLDLAAEVCKRNGWEFKVNPIDWNAKDAILGSGDITCIWNGFTMDVEDRESQYAFTEPYMVNAQVVVVKADSDIAALTDLKDKHVITQAGGGSVGLLSEDGDHADLAKTFAGGKVETIADYNAAFMQLEQGTVDAVACDLSIAMHQMNANADKYKMLDERLNSEHYAAGFKLGEDALAAKVTETLKAMDSEGFVKTLADKYDDIDYENWCLGQEGK